MESTGAAVRSEFAKPCTALGELLEVLALERADSDSFRGRSVAQGLGKIFGGQLSAQALSAAQQTVEAGKVAHSLHTQFLRAGDSSKTLRFTVEAIHDSRAFARRRVTVRQEAEVLCFAVASFHIAESGFEHQRAFMPLVPDPEELSSEQEIAERYLARVPATLRALIPKTIASAVTSERAVELRPVHHFSDPIKPDPLEALQRIWFRARGPLPDDEAVHQRLIVFASDFHFLGTAMRPHSVTLLTPGISVASLDNSVWFHRPACLEDWLLHSMESPSAQDARGFSRGQWFTRDGLLVASTAQEALIRR